MEIRLSPHAPVSKGTLLGLAIMMISLVDASAQSSSEGSVYSAFGLGERVSLYSSQSTSMGVTGTAFSSPSYLNLANPATWSNQIFARFGAGLDFLGVRAENAVGETNRQTRGSLGSLYLGFPLRSRSVGIAISYAPYTRVGYRALRNGELPAEGREPATAYEVNFEGEGGIHELTAGLGLRVRGGLSLGLSGGILVGRIETGHRTTFESEGAFLPEVHNIISTRVLGFTATGGVALRLREVLLSSDVMTLGMALTLPATLSANRTNIARQNLALEDTVGVTTKGDVSVPLRMQMGLTYAPGPKWLIAVDGILEPWSSSDSDLAFTGYEPGDPSAYNDRFRIGGGVQFVPAGARPLQPFLQRVAYRFGTYLDRSYVRPLGDDKLTTYGVSGGFGIPSLIPGTYVDLNGDVAFRGRTDQALVRDLLYRITVTINFGERWFVKRKLG